MNEEPQNGPVSVIWFNTLCNNSCVDLIASNLLDTHSVVWLVKGKMSTNTHNG